MNFNNIKGYDENTYTSCIPDDAYYDLKRAHDYAWTRGTPFTRRIRIFLPDSASHHGSKKAYRYYAGLMRSYAKSKGFPAVMMMARSSDPLTNGSLKIDMIVHVPLEHQKNFDNVAQGWRCSPVVTPASHTEVVAPDGTIMSDFNDVFSATSPGFAVAHPELPHKASGLIMGHRTFYSRILWWKHRNRFRRHSPRKCS